MFQPNISHFNITPYKIIQKVNQKKKKKSSSYKAIHHNVLLTEKEEKAY